MLQHLVKWAVVGALWRAVRPFFAGTVLAVVGLVVVDTLHAEFVEYVQLSQNLAEGESAADASGWSLQTWLLASFITKWLLFLFIVGGWLLHWRRKVLTMSPDKSQLSGLRRNRKPSASRLSSDAAVLNTSSSAQDSSNAEAEEDAAFDFLREKPRLRGRGEFVLGEKDDSR